DGNIWFLGNDGVVRFNPATNAIDTFHLPAGQVPLDPIVVAPDGKIWLMETTTGYQTDAVTDAVSIDPSTGTFRNYVVPLSPLGLAVAPDGTVWMTTLSFFNLESLNPATGEVHQFPIGRWTVPEITVSPDGHVWYGLCMGDNGLEQLDPSTGTITIYGFTSYT